MHRPFRATAFALLSACVIPFATGLALVPADAMAQISTRAYAPEDLRTLSRADQTRVISQEYAEQSRGARIPDDQLQFYLDQVNRSNWGFSRIKQDIATSLSGGTGPQPPVSDGNVVRCESVKNRRQDCAVPWRSTSRLSRQLSNTRCTEGTTWGSTRAGVWVTGGCRAEFVASGVGIQPPASGYSVTCSSDDGRERTCAWEIRRGQPRLIQQLSSSPCLENRTWGYRNRAVWVKNGCRARFGTR